MREELACTFITWASQEASVAGDQLEAEQPEAEQIDERDANPRFHGVRIRPR